MTDLNPGARLTGVLLLTSLLAMIAGLAIVVPSGLTLNPTDPGTTLVAVGEQVGLHLTELAFDVLGWLSLTAAGLVMAASPQVAPRPHLVVLAGGLLAATGLAGLLHDAGNLALTGLSTDPVTPATAAAATAVLLTAKWMVNLAGLLWVAAATTTALGVPMPGGLRWAGAIAALCALAAVALPWTAGGDTPSEASEQLGYALYLPIMIWYGVLGWRYLRRQ
ncbi:hypothetical protein Aph01nite_36250 [Acrocarpospora phusangensis]|uniref:DUF4386 domain-containing protein n=1 Tax=Acrocarpospora phusangensis TaxID=1070424 RepID=A0A919QF07_9ACTN|nr:hypothetical protein [Acrocarpospora phusangensis]GIH25315.1 hypothetical protein Aph01nite_36250 [Acrocarpospora phusangensis]